MDALAIGAAAAAALFLASRRARSDEPTDPGPTVLIGQRGNRYSAPKVPTPAGTIDGTGAFPGEDAFDCNAALYDFNGARALCRIPFADLCATERRLAQIRAEKTGLSRAILVAIWTGKRNSARRSLGTCLHDPLAYAANLGSTAWSKLKDECGQDPKACAERIKDAYARSEAIFDAAQDPVGAADEWLKTQGISGIDTGA